MNNERTNGRGGFLRMLGVGAVGLLVAPCAAARMFDNSPDWERCPARLLLQIWDGGSEKVLHTDILAWPAPDGTWGVSCSPRRRAGQFTRERVFSRRPTHDDLWLWFKRTPEA